MRAKSDLSFDDLYQEGRKRKRNEDLAQEIFGSKQTKSKNSKGIPKSNSAASLTARIAKPVPADRRKPNRKIVASNGLMLAAKAVLEEHDRSRNERALKPLPQSPVKDIQIRGAAGPYIIVAENFAIGTTAADIQSVMESVGGDIVSCELTSRSPSCTAEIAFADRTGADRVIETFHNKKADGRILRIYYKDLSPIDDGMDDVMETEDRRYESTSTQDYGRLERPEDTRPRYESDRQSNAFDDKYRDYRREPRSQPPPRYSNYRSQGRDRYRRDY